MASFEDRVMRRLLELENRLARLEQRAGQPGGAAPVAGPASLDAAQPAAHPPISPASPAFAAAANVEAPARPIHVDPTPTPVVQIIPPHADVPADRRAAFRSLLGREAGAEKEADAAAAVPTPRTEVSGTPAAAPASEPAQRADAPTATGAAEPTRAPSWGSAEPPRLTTWTQLQREARQAAGREAIQGSDSEAHEATERAAEQAAAQRMTLESWIGGRWFAVLGALAVLVAISLFLRMAYTRGMFASIPGEVRCMIGAAFGLLLMGGGEYARRKINAWASAGLTSAGVAGVYASVLAAYGMYKALPDSVAFVLLVVVSALGIAAAARSRLAAVAIVSLIGSYAAPFIIQAQNPNPLVFPMYLLALLATGLVLSAWYRGGFRIVGSMVWWATLALGGIWTLSEGSRHPLIASMLLCGAWVMVHAAHVVATRPERVFGPPVDPDSESPTDGNSPAGAARAWAAPPLGEMWLIASSFTFTTWAVGLLVWVARGSGFVPDWLPPMGFGGATGLISAVLAGRLRVLTDIPTTGRERLGAALMTQTGALIIAGTALMATGNAAVLVWLGVGLAAIATGRWIGSRGLDIYGCVVLAIGSGRWLLYESWASGMMSPWREHFGLVLSQWMLFGVLVGAAWISAAFGLYINLPASARGKRRPLAVACMAIGLLALMAACVHHDSVGTSVAIAWLGIGLACLGCGMIAPLGRRVLLDELGMAVLMCSAVRLVAFDSWNGGIAGSGTQMLGLVASPWMLACLVSAAAWLLAAIVLPGRLAARQAAELAGRTTGDAGSDAQDWGLWLGRFAAGMGVLMAVLAGVNERAMPTSIAMLWTVIGLVALAAAPARPRLGLAVMGVCVLGIAAFRLLVIDGLRGLPRTGTPFAGLFLNTWMLATALAGCAWLLAGLIVSFRRAPAPDASHENVLHARLPGIASMIGVALLVFSVLHPMGNWSAFLFVWLGLAGLALVLAPLRASLRLEVAGVATLAWCVLAWIGTHAFKPAFDWSRSEHAILLHPGLWSALIGAGLLVFAAKRRLPKGDEPVALAIRLAAWLAAGVLVWGATTLEAGRLGAIIAQDRAARLATVSIWWGIFSVGLIVLGFWRRIPLPRHAGLGLMALAGLKMVLYDLRGVPDEWRIASFLALGLLMIGIAIGYSKVSGALAQTTRADTDPENP